MSEIEKYLDNLDYKPIECLEDLGKEFKWWKSFRKEIVEHFYDKKIKIWVKLFMADIEYYLSTFVIDIGDDVVMDCFLKPNGAYLIRDNDDLECLKTMYDEFAKVKDDLTGSDMVC